jgi:hypothetical protein
VTECQGCGAWNDTSRTVCVLCGTPLAEIDEWDAAAELPPLPPLPDGGLRASMPSWLREPPVPIVTEAPPLAAVDPAVAGEQIADLAPLGTRADPRTFLSDDDFPQWLRDLAVRREGVAHRSATDPAPERESEPDHEAAPAAPEPAAAATAPAPEERHGRNVWETLLLVILLIGVIAAAIWALVANGVFPGP